jgi:hypothetical protein
MRLLGLSAAAAVFLAVGGSMAVAEELNCFDREIREKLPSVCKREQITASGNQAIFFPRGSAVTAWQKEVRSKFGEEYLDFKKSACGVITCSQAAIGPIGKISKRCTATGFPCKEEPKFATYDKPLDPKLFGEKLHRSGIRDLQDYLKDKGFYRGKVDGIWGEESSKAAQHYQREKGLSPIIGNDEDPTVGLYEQIVRNKG